MNLIEVLSIMTGFVVLMYGYFVYVWTNSGTRAVAATAVLAVMCAFIFVSACHQ